MNAVKDEPFLAWPGWPHLREAAVLSLANALWFALVYGGADWLTAHRAFRVPVHFAAELRIPFVPGMTVFYMSLYILFFLAPFILRTRRELRALVGAMAVAILASGIAFLLFPAELAFAPARPEDLGIWAGLYRVADGLNLTYNLLPSLHVTFAVLCVSAFSPRAPRMVRVLLWLWALLIAASTVLIHQHHVLDAVTGWLLATLLARSWGRATSAARCSGRTAAAP
ncbi:MAG: phosphatase PAP2 family protein [Thermoanaerobaculia bacterium]